MTNYIRFQQDSLTLHYQNGKINTFSSHFHSCFCEENSLFYRNTAVVPITPTSHSSTSFGTTRHKKKGNSMRRIMLAFIAVISVFTLALANEGEFTVKSTMYYAGGKCGRGTASGDRIVPSKVLSGEHRWVALSGDLYRAGFQFGDTIVVSGHQTPWVNGLWVVKDKMAHSKKIDFLVHRKQASTFRNSTCTIRKKLDDEIIPIKAEEEAIEEEVD